MQQKFRTSDFWKIIIILVVLLSVIFTFIRAHNAKTLPVYQDPNQIENAQDPVEKGQEPDVAMTTFTDPVIGVQIDIPSDWQQIDNGNMTIFTHKDSASTFEIEVSDYDPAVNNIDEEEASIYVSEAGNTFTAFKKDTGDHYELMYQDTETNIHDYIEEVYWDKNHIVKLTCIFSDANYARISPYYEKIINSMKWEDKESIPEGLRLYYNENPPFECAVPITWTTGIADGGLYSTDPETGASISASIMENSDDISKVTATDAANLLNTGYQSFMMNSFTVNENSFSAVSSYVVNNVQYQNYSYVYSDGAYWYVYKLDYENGLFQEDGMFDICKGFLRTFPNDNNIEQTDDNEDVS